MDDAKWEENTKNLEDEAMNSGSWKELKGKFMEVKGSNSTGELKTKMPMQETIVSDSFSFTPKLPRDLHIRSLSNQIRIQPLNPGIYLKNLYSNSGVFKYAYKVFDEMLKPNVTRKPHYLNFFFVLYDVWGGKEPKPPNKTRFHDPYEVLEKIGKVVYRLQLLVTARRHSVFHVPQLRIGPCSGNLTLHQQLTTESKMIVTSAEVLQTRVIISGQREVYRRLLQLVEEALDLQREACLFQNSSVGETSLCTYYHCGSDKIASQTVQTLQDHCDEVWYLQFSQNGKYLAPSSSDYSAIIWEVDMDGKISSKHRLIGHQNQFLAFHGA